MLGRDWRSRQAVERGKCRAQRLIRISACAAALFLFGLGRTAAQEIVTAPTAETYVAPAAPFLAAEPPHDPSGTLPEAEVGGEWMGVDTGSGLGDATLAAESASEPVELVEPRDAGAAGRWRFTPHLLTLATYDDNIFIQRTNAKHDYIFTVAGGVAFGFWDGEEERERYLDRQRFSSVFERSRGNLFLVDYTAIAQKFVDNEEEDSLDHDGVFEARWRQEKLTLAASAHLESKTETNVDIGGRVRRKTATSAVSARYEASEKTAIGVEVANVVNDPEGFIGNVETRGEVFLDYAATPLIRVGLGAAIGTVEPDFGANQIYQRVIGRAEYSLTDKIEAAFRGGVELRQFDDGGSDRVNPVFELRAGWQPAAGTELAIAAFRRVETSAAAVEEDYTVTGVDVSFRRELRTGLHLSLQGGYHNVRYTTTASEVSREDDYFFVRPALFYNFSQWGNVGVSYEHRRNNSDRLASTFTDNQTTVQVGLQY